MLLAAAAALVSSLLSPARIYAQQPRPPQPDTVQLPPAGPDSAQVAADTLGPVPELPRFPEVGAVGWSAGVWEWDREALLRERTLTLGDLLRDLPGLVQLRGGHLGMPEAATAFGLGAGRIRVFLDGFELDPLEGQALDFSRLRLAGVDHVRLERRLGELRIDLTTIAPFDRRPYTLLDVGTGDLETNYFRGVFAHAAGLGGSLALAVDRLDTEGTARQQPASGFTTWVKYGLLQGRDGGVQIEWRGHRGERDTLFVPTSVTRSDLILRARGRLAECVQLDAFIGRSAGSGEDPALAQAVSLSGRQAGARLAVERGALWGRGVVRLRDRRGLAATSLDLDGRVRLGGLLSLEGGIEWEDWGPESATAQQGRLTVGPLLGFNAFAEHDTGRRGIPFVGMSDSLPEASPRFDRRSSSRVGAEYRLGDLALGGAAVWLDVDSLRPLRFGPDEAGVITPGGRRSGVEGYARVPLLATGLRIEGALQQWRDDAVWPYLPRQVWSASLVYHDVFLPSGNLEILASLGLRSRPELPLPLPDPDDPAVLILAPPFESWSFYLQIRVVTVRLFVVWENLRNLPEQADFSGRFLPGQHALYGVKWLMWN